VEGSFIKLIEIPLFLTYGGTCYITLQTKLRVSGSFDEQSPLLKFSRFVTLIEKGLGRLSDRNECSGTGGGLRYR
jgi:hypothetical protein